MKQRTLAMMTGFEQYTRKTRRAVFLEEMEQVVPWRELCALVAPHYPQNGEICSLDRRGRPHFKNLLFRRGNAPCFFAFDLLTCDGKDLRTERLLDRKQELRRLLAQSLWESKLHRD